MIKKLGQEFKKDMSKFTEMDEILFDKINEMIDSVNYSESYVNKWLQEEHQRLMEGGIVVNESLRMNSSRQNISNTPKRESVFISDNTIKRILDFDNGNLGFDELAVKEFERFTVSRFEDTKQYLKSIGYKVEEGEDPCGDFILPKDLSFSEVGEISMKENEEIKLSSLEEALLQKSDEVLKLKRAIAKLKVFNERLETSNNAIKEVCNAWEDYGDRYKKMWEELLKKYEELKGAKNE